MSLAIQNDAGAEGAGDTVDPATVQLHLIAITRDTNIGQGATTGDLIAVTYTGAAADAPATRVSTLVNTNFNVSAGVPDIIVVGVGPQFTLLDGTTLCGNGVTIAPTAPPAAPAQVSQDNPTKSVYIIYDTTNGNGGGILVRAPGGSTNPNTYTTPTPGPDVLYHELSHAFRLAQARGVAGAAPQQVDDEVPAINDENVLRPLLTPPVGPRDPNPPHDGRTPSCAGPPGPNCCIVASIATGSPYSAEVNALRLIRDRVLRQSDIGYDFFQHLHHDYYSFSPEVCRLMAKSPELPERVRLYFVGPLVRVLELLYRYTVEDLAEGALAAEFDAGVRASELSAVSRKDVEEALEILDWVQNAPTTLSPALGDFGALIGEGARQSAFVRWALVEPIEIYVRALGWRLQEIPLTELGRRLSEVFDAWAARMPLTESWKDLSDVGFVREIEFLKRILVRKPTGRATLGRRLAALLDGNSVRLVALRQAGFITNEDEATWHKT